MSRFEDVGLVVSDNQPKSARFPNWRIETVRRVESRGVYDEVRNSGTARLLAQHALVVALQSAQNRMTTRPEMHVAQRNPSRPERLSIRQTMCKAALRQRGILPTKRIHRVAIEVALVDSPHPAA